MPSETWERHPGCSHVFIYILAPLKPHPVYNILPAPLTQGRHLCLSDLLSISSDAAIDRNTIQGARIGFLPHFGSICAYRYAVVKKDLLRSLFALLI